MNYKKCIKCKIEKFHTNEYFSFIKSKNKLNSYCKICEAEYHKQYRNNNRDKISKNKKQYRIKNKEKIAKYQKQYQKQYIKNNRDKVKEDHRKNQAKRRKNPSCKLQHNVSHSIYKFLNKNGSSKSRLSCWKHLSYSSEELKLWIESLFDHSSNLTLNGEVWMTWNNHGIYNPQTWNDNDPSTWTWQLDHIIPQSDLPYDSMEHPNFKKCWALENLRPLSAKQNLLDGVSRSRHLK